MERKITAKRALAFLLALEMFCTPLAMARAQDPERVIREIPLGEEAWEQTGAPAQTGEVTGPVAEPLAGLTPDGNEWYEPRLSFGIPLIPGSQDSSGVPTSFTNSIAEYRNYLTYEAKTLPDGTLRWGFRGYPKEIVYQDGALYIALPEMGRVPDKELEGFYITGKLPEGTMWYGIDNGDRVLPTWSFDEKWFADEETAAQYRLTPVEGTPAQYGLAGDKDVTAGNLATVARLPYNSETVDKYFYDDEGEVYCVPIVARWKASSQSGITAMGLAVTDREGVSEAQTTVFTEDPRGKVSPGTLTLSELGESELREFWLRVPEEEERLTVTLETFEPYYYYNVDGTGDCPVTAGSVFHAAAGKVEADLSANVHAGRWDEEKREYNTPITPAPQTNDRGQVNSPNNSLSNPARGQWTVADIPLTKVDEAADANKDPFTTITLTVTAPDGKTTDTYVLHVERLTTPVATLGYGNTPYGMIDKDRSARWKDENKAEGETDAETIAKNKQIAKAYFSANHTFTDMPIRPSDSGSLYPGEYSTLAWTGGVSAKNLDLDSTAVVAYLDMAFADPGVAFVDSEGRAVSFGTDAPDTRYTDCVKRTLRLLVTNGALTTDLYGVTAPNGDVSEVWYVGSGGDLAGGRLSSTEASQTLLRADGTDQVDLRGLKVLPGVYTVKYLFEDPVNHSHVPAERPLAILPIPGDVDMDGAVTHADAKALDENRSAWSGETGRVFRLLRERVYNDAQVRVGDFSGAAAIRSGFQPAYTGGTSNYFYRPLDTSEVYSRKTWAQVTADGVTAQAKLELRYLGAEGGKLTDQGHTNNITGPWQADAAEGVSLKNEKHPNAKDTFWVGVYLDLPAGSDLAGQTVRDLKLALTYDSEFVQPAVVYPYNPDYAYSTADEFWENVTFFSFNMGTRSVNENQQAMTIFSGLNGNAYNRQGFSRSRAFSTHYSKVEGELEQTTTASSLREVVIALQHADRTQVATLRSGYLLVLPFRLVKHPESRLDADNMARLIEISAGMSDLTLVTPNMGRALPGAAAARVEWMAQLMEETAGVRAASDRTYAFSAQTDIYGGATQNLRALVDCQPTADGRVLLGEDTTESQQLYNQLQGSGEKENGQYDKEFLARNLPLGDDTFDQSTLPPGLKYEPATGDIRGIPTAASAPLKEPDADGNLYRPYTFTIRGRLYSIVIEPRTLHYQVTSRSSYYGESNFRGSDSNEYTFTYTVADLAKRDVENLADTPTGNGAELETILADYEYTAPKFYAYDERTGLAVTAQTKVGQYPILTQLDAKANNYRFVYTPGPTLAILKRPIRIDYITVDYSELGNETAESYNALIYNNDNRNARTFTVDEGKDHGALKLCLPEVIDGVYGNLPLDENGSARVGSDKLKLKFRGQFQRNEYDESFTTDNFIHLQARQETRPIRNITSLELADDWATNHNYNLVYSTGTNSPEKNDIQGIVLRCGINSIKISSWPRELDGRVTTAGSSIAEPKSLRVQLNLENDSQMGDFAYDVVFDYNAASLIVWDLHYNWVSPEDMAAGLNSPETIAGTGLDYDEDGELTDLNPYGNGVLTTAMDGWYLCVAARKYDVQEGEEVEFVKTYSKEALHIAARPITLTPGAASRFYGDENPSDLSYTYDWTQLSISEQQWLKETMGYPSTQNPKGTPEELEALLAAKDGEYTLPKIAISKVAAIPTGENDPNLVKADTPRGTGQFYVILYGARSEDYSFRYTQRGSTVTSESFGMNSFTIQARPVVIRDLYSAGNAEEGTASTADFATIYADTRTLFLKEQVDGASKRPFTADVDSGRVVLETAGYNDRGQVTYYTHNDTTRPVVRTDVKYGDDTLAVLEKDKAALQVSYTVRFIPDADKDGDGNDLYGMWNDFTTNFYSVEALSAAGGSAQRYVEIGDLALTGTAANNYVLVYQNGAQADKEAPANAEAYVAPEPDTRYTISYQRYGTGTVLLRPIEDMELTSLGKMNYTYGETWFPSQPNGNNYLTLEVRYATRFDNDPARNVQRESLRFTTVKSPDPNDPSQDLDTDNFTQRGFTIYYLKDGAATTEESKKAAVSAGQSLIYDKPLYPRIHNNAPIFVVGKRGENDPEIYSRVSAHPVKVRKAALTLTAKNAHRFYGESNDAVFCEDGDAFGYTYDPQQLARWDRDTAPADLDGASIPALASTARPDSPLNRDKWGEYPISFAKTSFEFDNYVVTGQPGILFIYPRPIQINGINHSKTTDGGQPGPVYTIYNATSATIFTTQYDTTQNRLAVGLAITPGATTCPQTIVRINANGEPVMSGTSQNLPISGSTLVGSDELAFNVRIELGTPTLWQLAEGATDAWHDDMRVTVNTMAETDTAKNYRLSASRTFDRCWGAVKLRTIDHIHIIQPPKLNYTYGDTLDLSGLRVRIDYMADTTGVMEWDNVPYVSPEQFQSHGLYINYWDVGTPVPGSSEERKNLTSTYRKAHSGDHVTIAPTHDTQQYIGTTSSDPQQRPFAANGKTLIVSAFQATTVNEYQSAADPIILGDTPVLIHNLSVYDYTPVSTVGGNPPVVSGTNAAATIRVNPRRLTYTLAAEDKVYDGTKRAAGTVTLTNVFDATAQVKVDSDNNIVRESIKDAIYLPIGAAYESNSTNYADFTALTSTIQNRRVSFRSGEQPAGSDRLTFTFVNPNVHYEDNAFDTGRPAIGPGASYNWRRSQTLDEVTSAHDVYNAVSQLPAEVTNMRLLGPDAANYTWDAPTEPRVAVTEVLLDTRATAQDDQDAAPFATIQKADRPVLQGRSLLPSLAVDLHSNAVRLGLTQALDALLDRNDEFAAEAHFEYALFYDKDGMFTTWAGNEGDWDHQDTYFFGGEAVRPYIDPAYIPNLKTLPKPETAGEKTIYKGQLYPWAEEDEGVVLDPSAYPGGAESAEAYWFYKLYDTSRKALPRDTVFYPLVRLSESRNYLPSADLSGDEQVTAESLEAAKAAVKAWQDDPENETLKADALTASAAVLSAAQGMKNAAEKASLDKVAEDLARVDQKGEKEPINDQPLTAAAVKTFAQRLDLISASRERNAEGEDRTTEFVVELLEAVWFTDTLRYEDVKLLDSVVGNDPVRYYGYYWDVDRSAQLRINKDEAIDLSGDLLVTIRSKENGEQEVNVNPEENGGRTAKLYVAIESGSGAGKVRTIRITPKALYARLGDAPYPLGVVTDPPKPSNRRYTWSSSDPAVATVDENGVVTFRGLGEATITVTTDNQKSASILVVVSEVLPVPELEAPIFNFNFAGPWENVGENGAFRPHETMTRAQLVELMDIFLNPNAQWTATAELAYVDVTGKERYYDTLCRLTSAGVIQGVPGQAFAGEQPVTRAEFATMLCRMLQLEVPDTAGQIHMFEDAGQTETWAYAYIDALAKTGVMRGVGGGCFAPNRVLTREESAAVISRLLVTKLSSDQTDLKIPTDMTPANWSYEHVIRAVNAIAYPD